MALITGNAFNNFLSGGDAADTIDGGAGNDVIQGGNGDDLMLGGLGNDIFDEGSDPAGAGMDTFEGGDGLDTLFFEGSIEPVTAADTFTLSAAGTRAIVTNNIDTTANIAGIEKVLLFPQAGADTLFINDLTGTGIREVQIDLDFGNFGDGASDVINLKGSALGEDITVATSFNGDITVSGLPEHVTIRFAESRDSVNVDGGAGNDRISAGALPSGKASIVLRGGAGDDALVGSAGGDTLIGGTGADTLSGGLGNDLFAFREIDAGRDVITDFRVHGGSSVGDRVQLLGFREHTFADAVAAHHIVQVGADVVISDGAGMALTLHNVLLSSMSSADFLFS